jgi:hypothetical protein
MLGLLAIIIILLWLGGYVFLPSIGALIHILLVVALVLAILHLVSYLNRRNVP